MDNKEYLKSISEKPQEQETKPKRTRRPIKKRYIVIAIVIFLLLLPFIVVDILDNMPDPNITPASKFRNNSSDSSDKTKGNSGLSQYLSDLTIGNPMICDIDVVEKNGGEKYKVQLSMDGNYANFDVTNLKYQGSHLNLKKIDYMVYIWKYGDVDVDKGETLTENDVEMINIREALKINNADPEKSKFNCQRSNSYNEIQALPVAEWKSYNENRK